MAQDSKFALVPLGGCGEIGMNMTVLFSGDEVYFIDCGALFPDHSQPGVQLILPGYSYLVSAGITPTAWLITHGHEDHIGGLPYFFPRFPAPIYTSPFSAALIEGKFKDLNIKNYKMTVWQDGQETRIGRIRVTPFEVNHSIPDAMGLFIEGPHGSLLHTGDFRIDPKPFEKMTTDERIRDVLGGKRPDIMLSDSTNSFVKGTDLSESDLEDDFVRIMQESKGAVVVASFSSNVWRAQTIIDAARDSGRGVHLLGRGTKKCFDIAVKLGILDIKGVDILEEKQMRHKDRSEICILCTGSQGEPFSGLHRLAYDSVPYFKLDEGDTAVFSARAIPGNEKSIIYLTNQLCRQGVEVITAKEADIHVSGHGFEEDLKKCIVAANPKFFMPVHGEYRHLRQHRLLAQKVGMPEDHTVLAENGDFVAIGKKTIRIARHISANRSYVSQGGVFLDEGEVYRSRSQLARNGLVCVSMALAKKSFRIVGEASVAVFGVPVQAEVIADSVPDLVADAAEKTKERKDGNDETFAEELRVQVRRYVESICQFRCMVQVMLHRV